MKLNFVEKLVKDYPEVVSTGAAQSVESVREAASALMVTFPDSYVEYLLNWGWISCGPNEYFGIGTTAQNTVLTTKRVRQVLGLPDLLVVVCDHDGDEYVCLNTSNMKEGECDVVVWDAPSRSVSRVRASTFEAFLKSDMLNFLE
jgi:antitoxin YobK